MSILTVEQQNRTLSKGKKKRHEKVAKIVLDNPFPDYWPVLNPKDTEVVTELLSRTLIMENKKPKLPWKKLAHMTKERRKQEIENIRSQFTISSELKEQRSHIVLGLNHVMKSIEKSVLVSCLLAGDTQPVTIVKHIVTLASVQNIPILILRDMKEITKQYVGFSTIALGLKLNTLEPNSRFHELNNLIKTMSNNYSTPNTLKQWHNKINNISNQLNTNVNTNLDQLKPEDPVIDISDVYCYRTSNSYRAFIPENYRNEITLSKNLVSNKKQNTSNSMYQSESPVIINSEILKNTDLNESDENKDGVSIYNSVKLKYLQKNCHRRKRPLKKLKKP